jgi:hypothetical protein
VLENKLISVPESQQWEEKKRQGRMVAPFLLVLVNELSRGRTPTK